MRDVFKLAAPAPTTSHPAAPVRDAAYRAYIKALVDAAPPLGPQQRATLRQLVVPVEASQRRKRAGAA